MLVHNIEKRKIVLLMPLRTCGGKIIYTRNQELSRPHFKKKEKKIKQMLLKEEHCYGGLICLVNAARTVN